MKTPNASSLSLTTSRHCYVAHFDVLGTSALIESDIGGAWDILCDLKESCDEETLPIYLQSRDLLEDIDEVLMTVFGRTFPTSNYNLKTSAPFARQLFS